MYLKTIEIVGFKSFADKTRIDLKPGITGIIGPNGCGKSNIMESVRWCIGEMSWKSLRSDSMVSIIFAGTARRNAMNLCEVTLTFDNAQSQLPVQYSEVQVSRRIYRSGESEYYINKTQCRLRDIRELFLDTGIGNTGYAIIDQGGVDFVLNSKPEDRRSLFEEAAGVSKYKAKRQEALRKLDRVEIDLGRLQDSVMLINEQIKKLDADARKANLYQKYKVELAAMEAGQIIREIADHDRDSKAEEERIAPEKQKLSELHCAIDADEGRLAALELERIAQEKNVIEANKNLAERKAEIGTHEERRKNAEQTVRDIEGQLAASREDAEIDARRAERMEPELFSARETLAAAEKDFKAASAACDTFGEEFARLEGECAEADGRRKEFAERLLKVSDACQAATRQLSKCESRIGQLEFEAARSGKELEKKKSRAGAMRSVCDEAEKTLEAQRASVEEGAAVAAAREKELADARAASDDLAERIMQCRAEIASQEAKIEALEIQGQRDPYWVGAQAVVNADLPGVIGTAQSLMEVDDDVRSQIEDILGERLHAVVCRDLEAAKAGIEFLRGSGRGRARFLVASALPELPLDLPDAPAGAKPLVDRVRFHPDNDKVVRYLLGEVYAAENVLYGRHWVCGGAPEGEAPRLKLSDIGTLRDGLAVMENAKAALTEERKTCADGMPETAEAITAAKGEYQERMGVLHRLEAEQRQRRDSLRMDEEDVLALEEEISRIQEDIVGVRAQQAEKNQDFERGRREENELRSEEVVTVRRHAALKEDVAVKRTEKEHLDKSRTSAETQFNFLLAQRDRLAAEKDSLAHAIERRKEQQENWTARIRQQAGVDEDSRKRLEAIHVELAGLEKESLAHLGTLNKMQQESQELGRSLHERKGALDMLQSDIHASEMKVSGLKTRRELLLARLSDEWELTYEQAQEKYNEQPVDRERVEFLRRRIASLGNVNMAAPEEYEELSQKRDVLQAQIDDLLGAKRDLHSVIAKINATTRENFRQTFSEVQGHFRKLYGTLFEGGEADVVLTDKDNMLESGVDIVAQPPGKKLQSISQLSGGEKTLTAIALLFAFFMVKPSPMCMLDEADAALDDANVERFVSLIREFGSKTQFLIVSHNKLSMEACDAIYGVTMEESGVSQLISVDFKKRDGGETDRSAGADAPAVPSA